MRSPGREFASLFRRKDIGAVDAHLAHLAARGVTCLRFMLEYCQTENRYLERPAGTFQPNMVRLWDDLFLLCEKHGLRICSRPTTPSGCGSGGNTTRTTPPRVGLAARATAGCCARTHLNAIKGRLTSPPNAGVAAAPVRLGPLERDPSAHGGNSTDAFHVS
jgi:mannan endo-1,4-beta-mannosidase